MSERARTKADKPFGFLPTNASPLWKAEASKAFAELADCDHPCDWQRFKIRYQADAFLSKYCEVDGDSAKVRRSKAIEKWLTVDSRNAMTNFRLQFDEECNFGYATSEQLLETARGIVMDIIGEAPPDDLLVGGRFTNGASTRVKRSLLAVSEKFVGKADVTASAVMHFLSVLDAADGWRNLWQEAGNSLHLVPGSVMFTVPKTSEIDRVACKEPEINMFMQRAAGDFIRRRLRKKARIDLNDQTINQELARRASLPPEHPDRISSATIDLSSASDSVSTGLVVRMLPPAWFCLLDDIRVKTVDIDGVDHVLNMFSSMGNGFTFELESLLFYALARATMFHTRTKGRVSVFGDDLIVPKSAAPRFAKVLQWFGFKLNSKKSFWRGKFRESCGAHWYNGHDVTPFFLRGPMSTYADLINQLNQLRDWVLRDSSNGLWLSTEDAVDDRFICSLEHLWYDFKRYIPRSIHGGKDLESQASLVTNDIPNKRLMLRTLEIPTLQIGALLQWLHARDQFSEDMVTSCGSLPKGYTLGKNRHWVRSLQADQLFYHELTSLADRQTNVCPTSENAVRHPPSLTAPDETPGDLT